MTSLKAPVAALALAGGLFGLVSTAEAMPVAPLGDGQGIVVQAAYGCGPGWHPNRWGRCVPNRWARPVYRPYGRPYGYVVRPWHRPAYGYYGYGYGGPRWHHRWAY